MIRFDPPHQILLALGNSDRLYRVLSLVILLLALVLRIIALDLRPPHHDEGVNGGFIDQMWFLGYYPYDPTNYHGPLYFYLLLFGELLFGRGIVSFRFITALISTAIVLVVLLHRRWFGNAALWAALALAVSPGLVFYGRYAIHESLLVLSQAVFLYGFIRWSRERDRVAAACIAAGVVGSVTTKETFFIFFGTVLIAMALVAVVDRFAFWVPASERSVGRRGRVGLRFVLSLASISLLFMLALFSGFFLNPEGISDMFGAFAPWMATGTGEASGHSKPFPYYLELMLRYEWPLLIALPGLPLLLWHSSRWSWRLGATGFGLLLAYSLIPYKTPWLIIGILFPLAFAFGFIIERLQLWLHGPGRILVSGVATLLLLASLGNTIRINFWHYADFSEPYVYVHTGNDVNLLTDNIEALIERRPQERNMSIIVLAPDNWPLPWLFNRYPGTRYYADFTGLSSISTDVIIVQQSAQYEIEATLGTAYIRERLQLRDAQQPRWVYYRLDKFGQVIAEPSQIVGPTGGLM